MRPINQGLSRLELKANVTKWLTCTWQIDSCFVSTSAVRCQGNRSAIYTGTLQPYFIGLISVAVVAIK